MKKYSNHLSFKNFNQLSFKYKLKFILRITGLKKIIYNVIYFFLYPLYKSKSTFIKGLLFDLQKNYSKYSGLQNKYGEQFIVFNNDSVISKEILVKGEFDLKKLKKTINFLENKKNKKIKNLYDIGANIGVISIPAVKRRLVKKAYAVEPENNNFKLLKLNIELNNLKDKIIPYNYAMSNVDDEILEIELSHDNSGDHRVKVDTKFNIHGEENRNISKVKSKKFDTLFKEINPNEDLIWIDVQGYEPFVLSGAKNLLKTKAPIVVEFWPYALKRAKVWENMLELILKFDQYVDLSEENVTINEINKKTLSYLEQDWDDEKKGSPSLHTDLILLKN